MNYRMPSYYNDFKCIADKCPDTCCAGWAIVIDDKTMKKYKEMSGEAGDYIREHVDESEQVYIRNGARCSFLNDRNLCDLYINAGEDKLCKTCARYPRHFEEYGNLVEAALSMSCPVAAKMIVDNTDKDRYKYRSNDKISPHAREVDAHLLNVLLGVRQHIFEITGERKCSIKERMTRILDYGAAVQEHVYKYEKLGVRQHIRKCRDRIFRDIDWLTYHDKYGVKSYVIDLTCSGRYNIISMYMDMLLGLENINDNWPAMMESAKCVLYREQSEEEYTQCADDFDKYMSDRMYEYEHVLNYFLYTYFLGGVYDYNIQAMVKLAVLSTLIIRELGMAVWKDNGGIFTVEDQIKVCYQYSRQIEHSDENLMSLEGILTAHPAFCDENLKQIL